ncbi:MAG: hypothetical protein IPP80_12430 [Ignavibacteria bacterium]|nr:hypothetical protein [Ignavibacteria bacterium]
MMTLSVASMAIMPPATPFHGVAVMGPFNVTLLELIAGTNCTAAFTS